jgi:hypothetical protein
MVNLGVIEHRTPNLLWRVREGELIAIKFFEQLDFRERSIQVGQAANAKPAS